MSVLYYLNKYNIVLSSYYNLTMASFFLARKIYGKCDVSMGGKL